MKNPQNVGMMHRRTRDDLQVVETEEPALLADIEAISRLN